MRDQLNSFSNERRGLQDIFSQTYEYNYPTKTNQGALSYSNQNKEYNLWQIQQEKKRLQEENQKLQSAKKYEEYIQSKKDRTMHMLLKKRVEEIESYKQLYTNNKKTMEAQQNLLEEQKNEFPNISQGEPQRHKLKSQKTRQEIQQNSCSSFIRSDQLRKKFLQNSYSPPSKSTLVYIDSEDQESKINRFSINSSYVTNPLLNMSDESSDCSENSDLESSVANKNKLKSQNPQKKQQLLNDLDTLEKAKSVIKKFVNNPPIHNSAKLQTPLKQTLKKQQRMLSYSQPQDFYKQDNSQEFNQSTNNQQNPFQNLSSPEQNNNMQQQQFHQQFDLQQQCNKFYEQSPNQQKKMLEQLEQLQSVINTDKHQQELFQECQKKYPQFSYLLEQQDFPTCLQIMIEFTDQLSRNIINHKQGQQNSLQENLSQQQQNQSPINSQFQQENSVQQIYESRRNPQNLIQTSGFWPLQQQSLDLTFNNTLQGSPQQLKTQQSFHQKNQSFSNYISQQMPNYNSSQQAILSSPNIPQQTQDQVYYQQQEQKNHQKQNSSISNLLFAPQVFSPMKQQQQQNLNCSPNLINLNPQFSQEHLIQQEIQIQQQQHKILLQQQYLQQQQLLKQQQEILKAQKLLGAPLFNNIQQQELIQQQAMSNSTNSLDNTIKNNQNECSTPARLKKIINDKAIPRYAQKTQSSSRKIDPSREGEYGIFNFQDSLRIELDSTASKRTCDNSPKGSYEKKNYA